MRVWCGNITLLTKKGLARTIEIKQLRKILNYNNLCQFKLLSQRSKYIASSTDATNN